MRLLFILAHPGPGSFCAALARAGVEAALAAGHEPRLIDLYAQGFDPVMTGAEWQAYADAPPPPDLPSHTQALTWAEGVIFLYPTWWGGPPAMLKGWLDRVLRPGLAFSVGPGGRMRPGLTHLRLLGAVTTLGSPWWHWQLFMGAPGRRILLRGLRACTGWRARSFWLALHGIDGTSEAVRARFVARLKDRITRIPR